MKYICCILFLLLTLVSLNEDVINVHIIPHTHDDAGWLWSLEDYYTGNNPWGKCVKCILDNMLVSLSADEKRTFTYVEMAFFEKWYSSQSDMTKEKVKALVKSGRLDFANAGWVMNDEATAHYQHIIDQMRLGMHFLKKELDYIPKTAWYIDPFGHSLTNAYILKNLGFENLVMVRIDFREKEKLIKEKSMEFTWRPYYQLDGGKSHILTHITHGHYSPDTDHFPNLLETDFNPSGFDYKLDSIYNYFKTMSDSYPTRELMFLFGDDFTFVKANQNYDNIEAMIKAFDKSGAYKDKINFFYSTPSKYFKSVRDIFEKSKINLKNYDGFDFFPYSEYKMDYWTGYFTSRPFLKGLVRDAGNYLKSADDLIFNQLIRGNKIEGQTFSALDSLRRELGVAQHHDAVSGTAREAVSQDYISRLNSGISQVENVLKTIINNDLSKSFTSDIDSVCIHSNSFSTCREKVFEKSDLIKGIVIVYINSGSNKKFPLNFKINTDAGVSLSDFYTGTVIEKDLICTDLGCEVTFVIDFSDNQEYKAIRLSHSEEKSDLPLSPTKIENKIYKILENEDLLLSYDIDKGFIQKMKKTQEDYSVNIQHGYYEYHWWKDPMGKNRQGAYLMATDTETPIHYSLDKEKSKIFFGKVMTQIVLVFTKSKLKLTVYSALKELQSAINAESIISPNHPQGGLEFLLTVDSNIENTNAQGKTEFFTDTNGMRIIKRTKDTRQTFDFEVDDKVASNFYPVNSILSIKDSKKEISVWNDRPQAATSLNKGQVFFVMNRWSSQDDRKGLSDGIDESNSSNINFPLNHLISIKGNKDYIYDYMNKKPLYATYKNQKKAITNLNVNNEISKLFLKGVEKPSLPEDLNIFKISDKDCIEYNFYFINETKVLVQFLNKRDPFFNENKSCEIELITRIGVKIERMNLNGLDKVIEVERSNTRSFLSARLFNSKYSLDSLAFETFLVTFETR